MTVLGTEKISRYLSMVGSMKPACRFYDVHVHPYEILFDRFPCRDEVTEQGAWGLDDRCSPPAISELELKGKTDEVIIPGSVSLERIALIRLKSLYGRVGERTFSDSMALCGIDTALLLPVAPPAGEFGNRMDWMRRVFRDASKFRIGGSVSNSWRDEDINRHVSLMEEEYGIKALKCHPVVTGIDLGSSRGKDRIEAMLDACGRHGFPFIIHSGRNIPYWGADRGDCASLDRLKDIDWSISGEPVVIAHGGAYGCRPAEIEKGVLPLLKNILDRHSNTYVDISGIGFEPIRQMLRKIDHGRILFGSDALYEPQWKAVALFLHALEESGGDPEKTFVQVAGINPARAIFKEKVEA